MQHFYPFVLSPGFDGQVFVGKLDDMQQSLQQLARVANVTADLGAAMPGSSAAHSSEKDIVANAEKSAMVDLLASSPEWVARIVQRYTPDICVFNYNQTRCPEDPVLLRLRDNIHPLY